jgi:hypothetical protein
MPEESKRRGRWYESGGGIGLEIETDSDDPDFKWQIAGAIERQGKCRGHFKAMSGSGEAMGTGYGHYVGTFRTVSEAQDALVKAVCCEIIAAPQ